MAGHHQQTQRSGEVNSRRVDIGVDLSISIGITAAPVYKGTRRRGEQQHPFATYTPQYSYVDCFRREDYQDLRTGVSTRAAVATNADMFFQSIEQSCYIRYGR